MRVLERERAPKHRICGEFLSVEAQASLRAAGIDAEALGGARIDRLRLVHGHSVAEAPLPFVAIGLTRKRMDKALLARAETAGAVVERGVIVREIDGHRLTLEGSRTLDAPTLLLASGKHDVRGMRRQSVGTVADLVGFKSYFRLSDVQHAALGGHIEVLMFDGGYAGLQHVEDGMANLCLLVTGARLAAAGGNWVGLLAALRRECGHLEDRLNGSDELLDRPITISGVPYGYLHNDNGDGIYRLGDQFAVIPSFSGDGMSMAMHSGRAAADAVLRGIDASAYHAARRAELAPQVRVADRLYRLARPPWMQALAVRVARLWPSLLPAIARATRVPEAARLA